MFNHPKVGRLARILDVPPAHAIGIIVTLWSWVSVTRPDGSLEGIEAEDLGYACRWEDGVRIVAAMIESGWIDETESGMVIHEWMEYQGQAERGKLMAAKRQQRRRDRLGITYKEQRHAAVTHHRDEAVMTRRDETRQDIEDTLDQIDPAGEDHPDPPTGSDGHPIPPDQDPIESDPQPIPPDPSPTGSDTAPPPRAKKRSKPSAEYSPEFSAFWRAYPKKVGKDKAWASWQLRCPPLEECLGTLSWQTRDADWNREGGKFIPHPTTWLNQGRWADEPVRIVPQSRRDETDDVFDRVLQKEVLRAAERCQLRDPGEIPRLDQTPVGLFQPERHQGPHRDPVA